MGTTLRMACDLSALARQGLRAEMHRCLASRMRHCNAFAKAQNQTKHEDVGGMVEIMMT